jgi:hypothetical protein
MASTQRPTFGINITYGEDAPDDFYLGDDENIWNWILDTPEQGVLFPARDEDYSFLDETNTSVGADFREQASTGGLILLSLPANYFYWNGHIFDPINDLPVGLTDIADARRTVTVTTDSLLDDKAYIATMGLEEVTPKEFYNADLPPSRIIVANG